MFISVYIYTHIYVEKTSNLMNIIRNKLTINRQEKCIHVFIYTHMRVLCVCVCTSIYVNVN